MSEKELVKQESGKEDNKMDEALPGKAKEEASSDVSTGNKKTPWFLMIIVSIACSALSIFIYDQFFAQKVVAFDLKGFIAQQRDLSISGKLTDEQFKANLDRVESLMNSVPKRKVILMGDAVIKNIEIIGEKNSSKEAKQ